MEACEIAPKTLAGFADPTQNLSLNVKEKTQQYSHILSLIGTFPVSFLKFPGCQAVLPSLLMNFFFSPSKWEPCSALYKISSAEVDKICHLRHLN